MAWPACPTRRLAISLPGLCPTRQLVGLLARRRVASHPRPASAERGPDMARSSAQRPGNGRLDPRHGCSSLAWSRSWPVWHTQPNTARPWWLVRPRHPSASPTAGGSSHQAWPAEASVLCSCGKWRQLWPHETSSF
jgi:hypothetical protein